MRSLKPRPSRPRSERQSRSGGPIGVMNNGKLPPLLLLHPDDNILVARRDIAAGERVELDGETITIPKAVELGMAYVPGAAFFAERPRANTLRLSFVTVAPAQIERGVALLGQALTQELAQTAAPALVA